MTPDLYGTWLTAGNNLQLIGDWLAAHWPGLTASAAALTFAAWAIRRALRDANQHVNTILANPNDQQRKEKP